MSRIFEVRLNGKPDVKLKEARAGARKYGIIFHGTTERGVFHKEVNIPLIGKQTVLDGEYELHEPDVRVTLRVIPPGYTWTQAETLVRKLIGGQ